MRERRVAGLLGIGSVGISRSGRAARLRDVTTRPFEAIVVEYGPMVLRVCRAVLGPVEAEDAWSETFLAAMKAYPSLGPDSNIEAWLVTVAHRKAIDQWRGRSRRPIPVADPPESASTDGVPGGSDTDLWDALKSLPPKQRQSVAYHYLAGLPYAEVANVLGGSTDAARRAAADGIAALRRTCLAFSPRGDVR